jgi:glycosyltransferase involved in cell wall biosynthesis
LDVKIITLGATIEDSNFWQGFDWEKGGEDWLEIADLVVLPAFVEHKPRRILLAVAHKIPVIVSNACGVKNVAGIKSVENGDALSLRKEIENVLKLNNKLSKSEAQIFV